MNVISCFCYQNKELKINVKVEAMSKTAQAFILRQQGYSVEKTAKIVGKSVNFVQIWAKKGKTEGFARKPGSGRPTKNSSKILSTLKQSKYMRYANPQES